MYGYKCVSMIANGVNGGFMVVLEVLLVMKVMVVNVKVLV